MATKERLIETDEVLDLICANCPDEIPCPLGGCAEYKRIRALITADAVEVVRCINCQKHEPCEVRNRVWCRQMGRYMKEDGFCSEGVNEDGK